MAACESMRALKPKPTNYLYAFRESGAIYQPLYCGHRDDIPHQECTVRQLKYKG